MRMSGIGGQAVLEGIMMRNGEDYALAVRLSDDEIHVETDKYKSVAGDSSLKKIPFFRGVIAFIDSLVLGISTLMKSSLLLVDEEDDASAGKKESEKKDSENEKEPTKGKTCESTSKSTNGSSGMSASDKAFMGITLAVSLVVALAVFVALPLFLVNLCKRFTDSAIVLAIIEGAIKIVIFLGYLLAISRMKDIQRTFMYHGAEHKCINCIEHDLELNAANVRISSRFHKRCGTSFLFYVVIISVIIGFFIQGGGMGVRLLLRIILMPVIAGISYEFIRLAGCSDAKIVNVFAKPGLAMQKITTSEPDDDMIEVAIKAVEAVFDWEKFLEEGRTEGSADEMINDKKSPVNDACKSERCEAE